MNDVIRIFFSTWFMYFIFGIIFGSFLNVVIYRVPNGLSIISPPSSCPKCGHKIIWYENIPIISWIYLRAKCSGCGLPISFEYPLVELTSGLITAALFFYAGPVPELLIYIALSYTLFCIMVIDYKTFSIPHGLNITLLIVSVSAILMNQFVSEFLPVSITGSILGSITGFGILYLIQKVGKIIYKQEAMGMGDLFLLGSAGLILGPKLTLTAFILGSLFAVISYSIPSIVNLLKKKKEAYAYLKLAEDSFAIDGLDIDTQADILGLKLQFLISIKDGRSEDILNKLSILIENNKIEPETYLRLFFRFVAINDDKMAVVALNRLNSEAGLTKDIIKKVIHQDLIGYDSYSDNLKLLIKYSEEHSFDTIIKLSADSKYLEQGDKYLDSVTDIETELNTISDAEEKLSFLLRHNRYFQFNGFTAEQKQVIDLIEKNIDYENINNYQRYLSETAFVYFKDFYFTESLEYIAKLKKYAENSRMTSLAAVNIYNIALFRYVFFKQRLAFGPFLAIGIIVSLFWGNDLIQKYYEFLERMIK